MACLVSALLLAPASFGWASPQGAPGVIDPKVTEARIDAAVKPLIGKRTPSIAIVVQQGRRTLYRKAHGTADLAGKVPATPATPYKIASLSKAFTAVVIQGLADEGKVKLDGPIRPYFPAASEAWANVTVRQLLNQVSGIPEYTKGMALALRAKAGGPEEVLAWAVKQPLNSTPGTKFEYSNTNYVLLGLVAERAGGAPLEGLLQSRVFGPLGMKGAKLPRKGTTTPGEAEGARVKSGKLTPALKLDTSWPYAAGSVVASADDMALWLAGVADAKVLTEAQRAEAFTPAPLASGEPSFYGFGWVLGTRGPAPMISHGGEIDGFTSYVAYLPASDIRLVILTNAEGSEPWLVANAILDAAEGKEILPTIEDKDPKLTARLRTVVDKMLKGERDANEFHPGFLESVPDDVFAKTGKGLGELGPVQEFALLKDEKSATGRLREYRLKLGDATLTAVFGLGADGKISAFRLR